MNNQVFKWTKFDPQDFSTLPDVFDTKREDWAKPDTCIFEVGADLLITDHRGCVFCVKPYIAIQDGALQDFRWTHGIALLTYSDVVAWSHLPEPYTP